MFSKSVSIRAMAVAGVFCLLDFSAAAQTASAPSAGLASGPYRIAGTVVSKTDGHALARARVTVTDVKDSHRFQSLLTSDDGKYKFNGLAAGKYGLSGAKRGFINANYDQHDQFSTAIVTRAALDTEHLVLRLAPDAVISGKILDESGEPVRHATVTLYFDNHSSGVHQIQPSRLAQTDDLGEYEMTPLRPGAYFLSATAHPWYAVHPPTDAARSNADSPIRPPAVLDRALDVTYPVTYYPDVTAADEALAIPIRGGEQTEADIHLTPLPSLRVLVHVPEAGQNSYMFPRLEQAAFDGFTFVGSATASLVSPGLVELTGVPAGLYDIRFLGPGQGLQLKGVELTKDGEEIDGTKAGAASSVTFSIQVPGEATSPHLTVGLQSRGRIIAASSEIDSKGETKFQPISAGHYEVAVWGGNSRYAIARISAEGAEVSGHSLNISAGSNPLVSLTLVAGQTGVEGTVTRAGKGFAGAMVVLVPKDPEVDHDLFRRDQSDLDGTFTLQGVIPGSYTLVAIENGWDLDWSHPGVIGAYTKRGRKIEVGAGGKRTMNIAEAIEVQEK